MQRHLVWRTQSRLGQKILLEVRNNREMCGYNGYPTPNVWPISRNCAITTFPNVMLEAVWHTYRTHGASIFIIIDKFVKSKALFIN